MFWQSVMKLDHKWVFFPFFSRIILVWLVYTVHFICSTLPIINELRAFAFLSCRCIWFTSKLMQFNSWINLKYKNKINVIHSVGFFVVVFDAEIGNIVQFVYHTPWSEFHSNFVFNLFVLHSIEYIDASTQTANVNNRLFAEFRDSEKKKAEWKKNE